MVFDKSCLNIGGPPSKPKYLSVIDSERVPWGKGEIKPFREWKAVKIKYKEII
jgi:hypothetical protein